MNERLSFNQPICERCWINTRGVWEPLDDDQQVLTSVEAPVRVTDVTLEQCSFCGQPTIAGIYVRQDPNSVPFPALKGEDE